MVPISLKTRILDPSEFVISRLKRNSLKLRRETPHGGEDGVPIPDPERIVTEFKGFNFRKFVKDDASSLREKIIISLRKKSLKGKGGEYHTPQSAATDKIIPPTQQIQVSR